ncbi:MAG: metallophosphoesterase [Polyangiales bacterium]
MRRTLIVGDVHGCAQELDDLVREVNFDPSNDKLYLVGDLVARGPDSRGVVERVDAYKGTFVRGNHDEKVLMWWRLAPGPRAADDAVRLSDRHRAVVEALGEDHSTTRRRAPRAPLPEHALTIVHAGVDPRKAPDEASEEVLLTVRSIDDDGEPTKKLLPRPWARAWRGPRQLVFGHDARRNLQLEPYATGLDTGCCYGRELTAILLREGEALPVDIAERRKRLVWVNARAAYCPTGTGDGPE